jgi:ATP-dependent Clp protease ATP-binding subunit ClpA
MKPNFAPDCVRAIELAKRALPEGTALGVDHLLAALYHATDLKSRLPQFAPYLPAPRPVHEPRDTVKVAEPLKPILTELARDGRPVTAEGLFTALLQSEDGRRALRAHGVPDADLRGLTDALAPRPGWRGSPERQAALRTLEPFGRMLTATPVPTRGTARMDQLIAALVRTLSKMRRRNALLVGPPGTGKSALVYELARRVAAGHESIPPGLRDLDVFELAPAFLIAGASLVGQYEERVKALLQTLQAHPKIILFIDEIHSFFQSGVHHGDAQSKAHESFKGALARGDITCIGCTTPAEYRAFIAPDKALERRFAVIRLDPPSRGDTVAILQARLSKMEEHYAPLRVPEAVLPAVVDLAEEYLPDRYQPDKSIQLLDHACAFAATDSPPAAAVAEEHAVRALEDLLGHGLVRNRQLTEDEIYGRLRAAIVGQDALLRDIARAVVAGLRNWGERPGPRGVFVFAGPTGTGKTEVARLLAQILGGGREHLVRIDGNNLQGRGDGSDSQALTWTLLGAAPGYTGFVRGQGGLLGKVRDQPESVVLFDEFDKASPALGKLLLRVLDEGRTEDAEGNLLDFHRAFLIFTTNAGSHYDHASLGFVPGPAVPDRPVVDEASLRAQLRALGHGEEFLARVGHWFLFQSLDAASIREVIGRQLGRLGQSLREHGLGLEWDEGLVEHLAAQWQPRFGVRHLTTVLSNRVVEQLGVADAQGELRGVTAVRLRLLRAAAAGPGGLTGLASRERQADALVINLA